jgi:3-methyladenine DNA glycosylase AlkD
MVRRCRAGDETERARIYRAYLDHTRYVSNWDLVDASAPGIVGEWLATRSRNPLYRLARSRSLWERRIAIIATAAFIRRGETRDTLRLATLLLNDDHDLIHKAVGWMLRETGTRASRPALERFLAANAPRMPRTMLRYAIERFPEARRRQYLRMKSAWNGRSLRSPSRARRARRAPSAGLPAAGDSARPARRETGAPIR